MLSGFLTMITYFHFRVRVAHFDSKSCRTGQVLNDLDDQDRLSFNLNRIEFLPRDRSAFPSESSRRKNYDGVIASNNKASVWFHFCLGQEGKR